MRWWWLGPEGRLGGWRAVSGSGSRESEIEAMKRGAGGHKLAGISSV